MTDKVCHIIRKPSRRQHLWVFSNEILRTEGDPGPGETVLVYERGRLVGSGIYNPKSLIAIRLYSAKAEELSRELIRDRIKAAWNYRREKLPEETDLRLVYGESDRLPGLVIDKYGNHFVLQVYSAGFDNRLEEVCSALRELFPVASIFEKDDFRLRDPEGLPRRERLLYGTPEKRIIISENGVRFYVDIAFGQKTGYYYDHRLTRLKVRRLSQDRNVLDVFCYTGSFAINAALGGAKTVVAVDESAPALSIARDNAKLNGVEDRCQFIVADAFQLLSQFFREGRQFDLVNLDPPAFIKAQKEKKGGLIGYRRINTLAMKLLAPGGILVSSSCSHYLFWQEMLDMLVAAAQDAGRHFTILDRSTQGPDHPVLLSMPESEYLRSFILQLT